MLGFDLAGSDDRSGAAPPPGSTDDIIVTMTGQMSNDVISMPNNFTSRRSDYASPQGDITNLRCLDCSRPLSNSGTPTGAGPSMTIKRYLEYPQDVFHQVRWGGAGTRAFGGTNGVVWESDVILSSVTGQPLVIPAGAKFWWRTVNVTGSTVSSFPIIVRPAACNALGLDDGNASSDLGNSGTIAATSTANSFGPAAVVGTVAKAGARAFTLVGDSLLDGTGDISGVGASASSGWISRGLGGLYPSCKIAKGGQLASVLAATDSKFDDFLTLLSGYYTDVLCEAGINDLSQSAASAASILSWHQAIYARFDASARIWQTTMTARSTSTDSYATVANQTAKTDGNMADLNPLNAAIRAMPANVDGVIDAADFDMSARDSGVHAGPFPPTTDGTHFTSAKAAAMASNLAAAL